MARATPVVPSPSSPLLCPWGGPADSSCHLNGRHRLQATEHSHGHLLSSGLRLPVRRLRPPLSRPKLKPRKTEDVRYRCPPGGHSPRAGSTFNTTYWPGAGGFPCCWGRLPTPVRCPASLASFFFELQCRVGPPTGRGVVEVDWGGQSAPGDPAPGSPLAARTLREVLRRHTRMKPVPPAGGPGRRRGGCSRWLVYLLHHTFHRYFSRAFSTFKNSVLRGRAPRDSAGGLVHLALPGSLHGAVCPGAWRVVWSPGQPRAVRAGGGPGAAN